MFRGPWYIATRLWSVSMGYQAGGVSLVLMAMAGYAARCFLAPSASSTASCAERFLPFGGLRHFRRDAFWIPSSK